MKAAALTGKAVSVVSLCSRGNFNRAPWRRSTPDESGGCLVGKLVFDPPRRAGRHRSINQQGELSCAAEYRRVMNHTSSSTCSTRLVHWPAPPSMQSGNQTSYLLQGEKKARRRNEAQSVPDANRHRGSDAHRFNFVLV